MPVFQEQAMKVAIIVAGFTPAKADQLRRAMATAATTSATRITPVRGPSEPSKYSAIA